MKFITSIFNQFFYWATVITTFFTFFQMIKLAFERKNMPEKKEINTIIFKNSTTNIENNYISSYSSTIRTNNLSNNTMADDDLSNIILILGIALIAAVTFVTFINIFQILFLILIFVTSICGYIYIFSAFKIKSSNRFPKFPAWRYSISILFFMIMIIAITTMLFTIQKQIPELFNSTIFPDFGKFSSIKNALSSNTNTVVNFLKIASPNRAYFILLIISMFATILFSTLLITPFLTLNPHKRRIQKNQMLPQIKYVKNSTEISYSHVWTFFLLALILFLFVVILKNATPIFNFFHN